MKLIDGQNLDQCRGRFRDQPRAIARLMVRLAEAIHHAHQRGVLHRDLKPSNILVDEAGEPHVIDFGLAKRVGEASESTGESANQAGRMEGTPTYMSPEQATGSRSAITTATDVYGLGTILYALLAGHAPVLRHVDEGTDPRDHPRRARAPARPQAPGESRPGDDLPEVPEKGAQGSLRLRTATWPRI